MNSIGNYASDEEHHNASEEERPVTNNQQEGGMNKMTEQDVNYDNITMEMSEESSHHEPSSPRSEASDSRSSSSSYHGDSNRKSRRKVSRHRSADRSHSDSPDYHKGSRDYDRKRKHWRDDHYRDRDRERDREDRRSHRHSRSPSYHRYDRSRKSRSRSPRDRGRHSRRDYHSPIRRRGDHHDRARASIGSGPGSGVTGGSGCDRKPSKLSILEKLGIELKLPETDKDGTPLSLPSYYNPVAMNPAKYAEQIAKRKLLWGNAQKQKPGDKEETTEAKTTSVWQGARFSQDQDGKLTAKFQRLMGIKKDSNGGADTSTSKPPKEPENNLLKKQEELFSSMELQYEVARQATHTQRGVGLGFGAHHFTK